MGWNARGPALAGVGTDMLKATTATALLLLCQRGRPRRHKLTSPSPLANAIGMTVAALIAPALAPSAAGLGPAPACAAPLYWDGNGASTGGASGGAANGTWGSSNFWSTSPNGTVTPAAWVPDSTAVFSAGTNVTGTSNIGVSGTQTAVGLVFEEGIVILGGSGTLALSGGGAGST